MNSLLSYGSDDDLNDSGDEGYSVEPHGAVPRNYRKPVVSNQDDTNYDEVQMSLSEDSDSETNSKKSKDDRAPSRDRDISRTNDYRRDSRDSRYNRNDDRSKRDEERYGKDDDRSKYRDRDDKEDDRNRNRDDDRNRDRNSDDRDDDRTSRDRREDRRARSKDRDRYRDDRYSRDRRDRDRRRSRSRSRDRRRSRSPKRDRSRSRSRDRAGGRGYYKKFDRPNRDRFDDRNNSKSNAAQSEVNESQPKDRFFMPGITGRFREQIEKRKLLWQKGKEIEKVVDNKPVAAAATPAGTSSKTTKVWETTTFAQDSDGKVANKFKRLMGIKTPTDSNKVATEVLKKQEEMFSSMEAQYEVARTATHTMRGVGLGFGSYQR